MGPHQDAFGTITSNAYRLSKEVTTSYSKFKLDDNLLEQCVRYMCSSAVQSMADRSIKSKKDIKEDNETDYQVVWSGGVLPSRASKLGLILPISDCLSCCVSYSHITHYYHFFA
jgi:hypothetical protein